MIAADLCGRHLGKKVTVTDGKSSITGILTRVEHSARGRARDFNGQLILRRPKVEVTTEQAYATVSTDAEVVIES